MNRHVLLVDDSADFREGVRRVLAPHFEVSAAASGAEALACVEREGPFAVVVSDHGMPGMSGVELLAELRERWPATVRIMLTGCADLGLALEALEQGAIFRFLTKPPPTSRLVAAVAEGVERFHRHEEERLFTEQLAFAREALESLTAVLERRLGHERARTLEARRATLRALEALARHRDDETGEHLRRVSAYCAFLARALREEGRHAGVITDEFVEHIALAAPLHDLGKVAIPDAILFKPGKLDQCEWDVMRTHAQVGADILRGALDGSEGDELLRMAHEIAWTHHERWDGTGYPRRLAREEIPLAGRIMALADCYDALTSERPYKHAWPHEAAVRHVREQRGQAFDPALVDAFLARLDGIREILAGTDPLRTSA